MSEVYATEKQQVQMTMAAAMMMMMMIRVICPAIFKL
jgi:uncharacterized membrane protein affecting hemolysin expression